ncbi:hypothetical protein [Streptomyces sp. DSM 40907]|uniref:hypothetical protein n=1 Tax=Streptomyces kutzneri TaxID=3051179 RepID=UPI0028D0C6D4|nr:hypothetical protein [Streptomyces sp. DSM 40907]
MGNDASSPMVAASVLLLAPDRTVATALRGLMPRPDWLAMTDGRGVLWFCGDLRVGGWIARPADVVGSLTWMDKVDPTVTTVELTPREIALEDVVMRAPPAHRSSCGNVALTAGDRHSPWGARSPCRVECG